MLEDDGKLRESMQGSSRPAKIEKLVVNGTIAFNEDKRAVRIG